jgi:hypothetical protein
VARAERGTPSALAATITAERRVLHALLNHAQAVLAESGRAAEPDLVRRVASTLVGTAADPALRGALRDGVRTAEVDAPDAQLLGGRPHEAHRARRWRPNTKATARTRELDREFFRRAG